MSDVATLSVSIIARDDVSPILKKLDAQLDRTNASADRAGKAIGSSVGAGAQKAASGTLALQQAQARLEAQQGNLAGAADRLRNALAQQTTTTVQSVNAQRQLLTVQKQLETGTSALGGHFKSLEGSVSALGSGIGGIPGQLLSVTSGIGALTAAAGIGVGVLRSFGDAFVFQAQLDATTASITAQLKGVRDSGATFASAAKFANEFKLTQQETTEAISASIGVMRASKAPIEDILGVLARMQVLSPEQSLQEAAVALKALASGDTTSLVTRFEVGRDVANQMKNEIQGGADAVAVMSQFLSDTGIGMDVLKTKTEGASGAMKDLAIAQENVKKAQGAIATSTLGVESVKLYAQAWQGLANLLNGDVTSGYKSLGINQAAAAAAQQIHDNAIAAGRTELQAAALAQQVYAEVVRQASIAEGLAVAATDNHTKAVVAHVSADQAAAQAAAAATQAIADEAVKAQIATVAAQELSTVQAGLAQAAQTAANVILAGGGNIAATASRLAASSSQVDVLTAAYLRLAAAQAAATGVKLQQQTARQLIGADSDSAAVRAGQKAAIRERRDAQVGAARAASAAERNYQQTLGNTAPALAHARAELAQLTAGSAAYINKQNEIAQLQQKADKATKGGGGGGGVKLTDQQKLNNALLADSEKFLAKEQDLWSQHAADVEKINIDFYAKLKAARDDFNQTELDSNASFYEALGNVSDHGLQQAMSAQYEAAFQEAEQIAQTKGADVADAFLKAKEAAILAQGKRTEEISRAEKEGDAGRAEFLRGVDAKYKASEDARLARIKEGGDSIAAEHEKQLADESAKYQEAQDKIGTSADQAAARKITAAERAGQAIDAEKLKVDGLKTSYDLLGVAGTRVGVTPAGTAPAGAAPPAAAPVVSQDMTAALDGLRAAIGAVERATRDAGKGVEGAVSRLSGRFLS